MEIQTTIQEFSNKMKKLNMPPETLIKVIIDGTDIEPGFDGIPQKGKWAKVVERLKQEGFLRGKSDHVNQVIRNFRDTFALK